MSELSNSHDYSNDSDNDSRNDTYIEHDLIVIFGVKIDHYLESYSYWTDMAKKNKLHIVEINNGAIIGVKLSHYQYDNSEYSLVELSEIANRILKLNILGKPKLHLVYTR
jgi:hypothetical protein